MEENKNQILKGWEINSVKVYQDGIRKTIKFNMTYTDDGFQHNVSIPYDALNTKAKLSRYLPDGCIDNNEQYNKLKKHLISEAENLPLGKIIPSGYTRTTTSTLTYGLGDTAINPPAGIPVSIENPHGFHFVLKEHSTKEMRKWLDIFLNHSEANAALLLSCLSPIASPFFKKLKLNATSAYIQAKTATGKTTVARLLTDVFPNKRNGCNLSSDMDVILNMISTTRNFPCLIDDLNKKPIGTKPNNKEEKLCTLISILSGAGDTTIKGVCLDVENISYVITAEYTLSNDSTINRTILILLEKSYDTDTLTWLEDNKSCYTYFLYKFIEWICTNEQDFYKFIRFFDYKTPYIKDCGQNPNARIVRSYNTLCAVKMLLLTYMVDVGIISNEERMTYSSIFDTAIDKTINDTASACNAVHKEEFSEEVLEVLSDIICNNNNTLVAKSFKSYKKHPGKYILFIHDNGYYFRCEVLLKYLQEKGLYISAKKLIKILSGKNLLCSFGKEKSKKFSCTSEKGLRYYCIPFERLEAYDDSLFTECIEEIGYIMDKYEEDEEDEDYDY